MSRVGLVLGLSTCIVACVGLQDLGHHPGDAADSTAADSASDATATDSTNPSPDAGATDETVLIPAGSVTVIWSGEKSGTSMARITHDFWVDRHEVTVGQFRAWLDAGMPAPCPGTTCSLEPGGPYAGSMRWNPDFDDKYVGKPDYKTGCTDTTFGAGDDSLPMNCVTFAQALAVCHFRGMRLLTEVEWYYVASGRGQQRTYPWGDTAPTTCTQAIFTRATGDQCGFPKPVSTAPGDVSRDGVRDLAGSLSEWTYGSREPSSLGALPDDYAGVQPRPTALAPARGGNFTRSGDQLQTSISSSDYAWLANRAIGFRCAKTKL